MWAVILPIVCIVARFFADFAVWWLESIVLVLFVVAGGFVLVKYMDHASSFWQCPDCYHKFNHRFYKQ